jgi:hypothetical protein
MSTRCRFIIEDWAGGIAAIIFRHRDGYPEETLPDFQKFAALAWPLPRFEPDEYAAAIVAVLKKGSGGIRVCHPVAPGYDDTAYHYTIKLGPNGQWSVIVEEREEPHSPRWLPYGSYLLDDLHKGIVKQV